MSPHEHDEADDIRTLLRGGYAADVDPGFSADLRAGLQQRLAWRRRFSRLGWAAAAAGVILAIGLAWALLFRPGRPHAPNTAGVPGRGGGSLIVSGRMIKWDPPVIELSLFPEDRNKLDAATVQVDLDPAPDAGWLNAAAGKDLTVELLRVSDGLRPKASGRILSWGGITELPPRTPSASDTVFTVVVNGPEYNWPVEQARWRTDEWGMPR